MVKLLDSWTLITGVTKVVAVSGFTQDWNVSCHPILKGTERFYLVTRTVVRYDGEVFEIL